jgi:flagellar hook-basal body complex protein FliE
MAGIQGTGGLANEAFRAALRAQQEAAKAIGQVQSPVDLPGAPGGISGAEKPGSFVESLEAGLREVAAATTSTEAMPEKLVTGEINEFHQVAVELKQSDLSFRFALQVRNKLIDAYREVMRMSV